MIPPVVDVANVTANLDQVILVDCRWYLDGRSGREAYLAGHLPGALFADLGTDLAGAPSAAAGRHPLPDPEAFAAAMARLGIGGDDAVVAYDDAGGTVAARLVWMLRALGHNAALLDGGIAAWPGALETEPPRSPPAIFPKIAIPAERLASIDEVAAFDGPVIDARDPGRFRGEGDPVDLRTGHIPGATSLPCRENLDEKGHFLSPAALRERFAAVGIGPDTEVISYCGSGVTACHNLLALEYAGLGRGRLYPGSWSQWSADPERPIEVGEGVGAT